METNYQTDEKVRIHYGMDIIKYKPKEGSLFIISQLLDSESYTFPVDEFFTKVHKAVPIDGSHAIVKVDNTQGYVAFVYTSPKGKEMIKDRLERIKKGIEAKLGEVRTVKITESKHD